MRRLPRRNRPIAPRATASAIIAEPVSVVMTWTAPSRHGSVDRIGSFQRSLGLGDVNNAFADLEICAERIARPADDRVHSAAWH